VATHAIGDRGNRLALDAYEAALKAVPTRDHRFRIEHAQVLSAADIPRFAALGVIPSMQTVHQTSDMRWAEARLGPERVRGAYAWRSLLATGVVIPNGTDFPVEAVNPLLTFHAAVTRQDANNEPSGGWYPEQRMTRAEAQIHDNLARVRGVSGAGHRLAEPGQVRRLRRARSRHHDCAPGADPSSADRRDISRRAASLSPAGTSRTAVILP